MDNQCLGTVVGKTKLGQLPQDVEIDIRIGDAFVSVGDRKADACLIYSVKQAELLGLRMKYDRGMKKFHIIGYWTP